MKNRVQQIIEKYTPLIDDRFQLFTSEICEIYDLSKNDPNGWAEFNLIANSFKLGYSKGYNAAKKQASENSTPPIFANNQI
ncbi:hypothetical protein IJ556_04605 [bacterium]|nr:hypothetical protein [bacterium]